MELWLLLSVAGVVFLFLATYVVIMLVWPEWVGITGKVALEAERSHRGGAPAGEDAIDRLHKREAARTAKVK